MVGNMLITCGILKWRVMYVERSMKLGKSGLEESVTDLEEIK